jgi:hypothetical protein
VLKICTTGKHECYRAELALQKGMEGQPPSNKVEGSQAKAKEFMRIIASF